MLANRSVARRFRVMLATADASLAAAEGGAVPLRLPQPPSMQATRVLPLHCVPLGPALDALRRNNRILRSPHRMPVRRCHSPPLRLFAKPDLPPSPCPSKTLNPKA
eukprot:34817-Chlamydomonas_euryale.AAC.2